MQNNLPFIFERNLYRDVARFKKEHPGVLEARTEQRKKKGGENGCRTSTNLSSSQT